MALKSAPKYTSDSTLLTKNLCSRYKVYAEDDRVIVQNIVALALDAASSRDFREKAEFILTQAAQTHTEFVRRHSYPHETSNLKT